MDLPLQHHLRSERHLELRRERRVPHRHAERLQVRHHEVVLLRRSRGRRPGHPGPDASSSVLVEPGKSPLCGSLGGNMPKVGACVSSDQLTAIHAWLAAGAQND
jgi:hypothetical protein